MKKYLLAICVSLFSIKAFALNLISTDIAQNSDLKIEQIASSFGCNGKNMSPQLSWKNAPPQTKSFAITSYDPDAPTGSGFWHWIVYDINKSISSITTGASNTANMPQNSVEALNDANIKGYLGGCPPSGNHRYVFTIYALDIDKLPVNAKDSSAMLRFKIMHHVIAKASITTYGTHI